MPHASIKGFFGEYRYLSNFHLAPVVYEGITYPSTEAAFQAAKTHDKVERQRIANLPTPGLAKKAGRLVKMRRDWDSVRISVMEEVCWDKFSRHPDLRALLLSTGDAYLEETNTWNDKFWGVCGTGENNLGKILMRIRTKLLDDIY